MGLYIVLPNIINWTIPYRDRPFFLLLKNIKLVKLIRKKAIYLCSDSKKLDFFRSGETRFVFCCFYSRQILMTPL